MWFANKNIVFDIFRNNMVSVQTETHINAHTYPQDHALTPTHLCKQPNTPTLLQATDTGRLVVRVTEWTFISYHVNTLSQHWLQVMLLTGIMHEKAKCMLYCLRKQTQFCQCWTKVLTASYGHMMNWKIENRNEWRECEDGGGCQKAQQWSDRTVLKGRRSKVIHLCLSLTLFTLAKNLTYNPKLNMIPSPSVSPSLPPLSLVINRAVITRQDR